MSLGRLYAVPQDLSALKRMAEEAGEDSSSGSGTPSGFGPSEGKKKRKNTKKNPHAKLYVSSGLKGEDLAADYEGEDEDLDDDYVAPPSSSVEQTPLMNLAEYKKATKSILSDFLRTGDIEACLGAVHELRSPFFHYEFVKRALTMAISEGDDGQRESMSRLLSTLYGLDVTMLQIGNGFERLLESIDDLSLDCPNAKEVAAKFLARAIADEILPPAFVQDPQVAALAPEVLESARALLTVPHAYSKLAHCWGVSGGLNDVEELKAAVKNAILELYTSGDVEEAVRCVKGFKVPHFLHEAVYRLIILALEAYPDTRKFDLAVSFLKQTVPSVISRMQATLGFKRAAAALADLEKDAPKAGNGFRKLFAEAEKEGILAAGAASETSAGAVASGTA